MPNKPLIWTALLLGAVVSAGAASPDGPALYKQHCATCHETGAGRAAEFALLRELPPETIFLTLTNGSMRFVGGQLHVSERQAIARFVSRNGDQLVPEVSGGECEQKTPLENPLEGPRWNGWGVDLRNTRFQPGGMAGLAANDVPKLKLKWAFGFAGVDGMLYVNSGYGQFGTIPGNVLLAFSVDGER